MSWLLKRSFSKASTKLKIVKSVALENKVSGRLLEKYCLQDKVVFISPL